MPSPARLRARRTTLTGPPPATIRGAGATNVGHVRLVNQDAILVAPDLGLYAVLDGMGGGPAGDVAAQMAADVMAEYVRMRARSRRRWPRQVLDRASRAASELPYVIGSD